MNGMLATGRPALNSDRPAGSIATRLRESFYNLGVRRSDIDEAVIRKLLERHRAGDLDTDALVAELAHMPYANLGFARVDHHREVRTGFPEVVFGEGKTPEQVGRIAAELLSHGDRLLVTRASAQVHSAVLAVAADAVCEPVARTITVDRRSGAKKSGRVSVVSGGTADLPVAMEAVITAEMMDRNVDRHFDIGVAGLHRLLDSLDDLRKADAIVAVAGMDGALPAVLAGLVSVPVIAVPTSVGYGASFEGVGPLLTMLNACAPGVAVVNIDNGFGAGYMAAQITKKDPSP